MKKIWPRSVFLAAGFLAVAAFFTAAHAQVDESLVYHYYPVTLPRGGDWSATVNASAPLHGTNNEPLCGYTETDVTWDFGVAAHGDGTCSISWVRTSLRASITLPDLLTDEGLKLKQFRHYRDVLHSHELGHLEIARSGARRIDARISSMRPMQGCEELTKMANAIGDSELKEVDAENIQHDNPAEYARVRNSASERIP